MLVIPAYTGAWGEGEKKAGRPWSSLANQLSRIGELWVLVRVSDSETKTQPSCLCVYLHRHTDCILPP